MEVSARVALSLCRVSYIRDRCELQPRRGNSIHALFEVRSTQNSCSRFKNEEEEQDVGGTHRNNKSDKEDGKNEGLVTESSDTTASPCWEFAAASIPQY